MSIRRAKYSHLSPVVEDMTTSKKRLDALWERWALFGNPYADPALLKDIALYADRLADSARSIADAVERGEEDDSRCS
jgi:hypothetical protein